MQTPLPNAKAELKKLAAPLADPHRPGDYGQALMDLGATICTPTSPQCGSCVWQSYCAAFKKVDQTEYPKKLKKKKLPVRYGAVFVLKCGDEILLERRPDAGLLGGMMGFPGSEWGVKPKRPLLSAPIQTEWKKSNMTVRHIFTHFELRLEVYTAVTDKKIKGEWADIDNISNYALPTVMKKVVKAVL